LQPLQRLAKGSLGSVVAGVLDPELRGDEQLIPGNPTLLDGLPTASSFRYEAAVSIDR